MGSEIISWGAKLHHGEWNRTITDGGNMCKNP